MKYINSCKNDNKMAQVLINTGFKVIFAATL